MLLPLWRLVASASWQFVIFVEIISLCNAQYTFTPRPKDNSRFASPRPHPSSEEVANARIIEAIRRYTLKGEGRKVRQLNYKVRVDKYFRDYYLGSRYWTYMPDYQVKSRFTCNYTMNSVESEGLIYETDKKQITHLLFQCIKYQEFCCGLRCCYKIYQPYRPGYPSSQPISATYSTTLLLLLTISPVICSLVQSQSIRYL